MLVTLDCFPKMSKLLQCGTEIAVGSGEGRVDQDGIPMTGEGLVKPAKFAQCCAQIVMRHRELWI